MIGQCFGCQVLASALVERDTVFKRDNHEGGRGTISLTKAGTDDPLTQGIAPSFDVYHWHGDEVKADNSDIIVLADGLGCGNHLWRWSKGPVWGIQPHPEMNAADLNVWLEQNRDRFERKGQDVEEYLSQYFSADTAFEMMARFVVLVKLGDFAAEILAPQKSYSKRRDCVRTLR
jgi:GMP synthase (glutamine-hydrolysing)